MKYFIADNGTQGLNDAYQNVPDLIISDVVLPGISGKVDSRNTEN
jgi:YesN/AraC family two-component response regulator